MCKPSFGSSVCQNGTVLQMDPGGYRDGRQLWNHRWWLRLLGGLPGSIVPLRAARQRARLLGGELRERFRDTVSASYLLHSITNWHWLHYFTKSLLWYDRSQEHHQTFAVCLCLLFRLKTGLGWWGMWFCTAVSGMTCTLASRTASVETQMSTTTGAEKRKKIFVFVAM